MARGRRLLGEGQNMVAKLLCEWDTRFYFILEVRYLKKDISNWNREVFGKIDTNRNRALEELTAIEHASENRAQTPEENPKFYVSSWN